jgi:hypothetical protein
VNKVKTRKINSVGYLATSQSSRTLLRDGPPRLISPLPRRRGRPSALEVVPSSALSSPTGSRASGRYSGSTRQRPQFSALLGIWEFNGRLCCSKDSRSPLSNYASASILRWKSQYTCRACGGMRDE